MSWGYFFVFVGVRNIFMYFYIYMGRYVCSYIYMCVGICMYRFKIDIVIYVFFNCLLFIVKVGYFIEYILVRLFN